MTADKETDDLFDRPGLPEDLKFLLASYPRERWGKGITLNLMSGFWIKRHNMFRELAASPLTVSWELATSVSESVKC